MWPWMWMGITAFIVNFDTWCRKATVCSSYASSCTILKIVNAVWNGEDGREYRKVDELEYGDKSQ